jgi:hypothetical protein
VRCCSNRNAKAGCRSRRRRRPQGEGPGWARLNAEAGCRSRRRRRPQGEGPGWARLNAEAGCRSRRPQGEGPGWARLNAKAGCRSRRRRRPQGEGPGWARLNAEAGCRSRRRRRPRGRAQDGPDSIRLAFTAIPAYGAPQESARQSLCAQAHGGKSGLQRARCQVTPGGREPTESATERYRLSAAQAVPARVKWCGKSAPRWWQHQRHGKPHLEQDQIGKHAAHVGRTCGPHEASG